jgi:hypothetical protein
MNKRILQMSSCSLAIALGAIGCGGEAPQTTAVETTKSALMTGSCKVPDDWAQAAIPLGHKSINGSTLNATQGDSLLPANNVALGTFAAGTTIIVGFTGLNQSNLSGDTYIRLFDGNGTQVAYGDDACGTYGSRIVYTVPQGYQSLTVRLGCYDVGYCAGDLAVWSRLDSNGQLTNAVVSHAAIITGSDANANSNTGTLGGTSVRQLTDQPDWATHRGVSSEMIAPTDGGGGGYINNGYFSDGYSHFEGVQRLRTQPDTVVVSGSYRGDLMFGFTGLDANYDYPGADKTWLQSGATTAGWLEDRYSIYDETTDYFSHFGGIQTAGQYILGGISNFPNPHDNPWGRLMLFDASTLYNVGMGSTMRKWTLDPEVLNGITNLGIGPSQVGITKLLNGSILIAESRANQSYFDFYVKRVDELDTVLTPSNQSAGFADIEEAAYGTPSAPNYHGWSVLNGPTGVQYQTIDQNSLALVTQTNGDVYMLAGTWDGNRSRSTSWIQKINTNPDQWGTPQFGVTIGPVIATNVGYNCANGSVACNFLGASGFYINSFDDSIYVYSTSMYLPFTTNPPTSIGISEFSSDLAYNKAVTSSSAGAYAPSSIVNGNLADAGMTNSDPNAWMWVDMGNTKTVTGVKVVPCPSSYSSCPALSNYDIWTWNGSAWVSQFAHPGTMSAGAAETLTFAAPVQARWVLIQLNSTTAKPLGLAEMQIF